jgi:phosphonopyruvate decarboxylase
MHMGALAIIGQSDLANFVHVVVNNGAHDSVGGQPTTGFAIDLCAIATACGYRRTLCVSTDEEAQAALSSLGPGPVMLEIRVNKGARENLGRPKSSPIENKTALMAQMGVS